MRQPSVKRLDGNMGHDVRGLRSNIRRVLRLKVPDSIVVVVTLGFVLICIVYQYVDYNALKP